MENSEQKSMKKLNERQIDEYTSLAHYIDYVLLNQDIKDYEIYDAVMRLNKAGQYLLANPNLEGEMDKLLKLDNMKDLIDKFMNMLMKRLKGKDDENFN